MEERNVTVTLNKAKEWFNSGNATLKEIALQAFNKDELTYNFKNITTFQKACEALGLNYGEMLHITMNIATISKASAAMFELNIIRKALNLGLIYTGKFKYINKNENFNVKDLWKEK